MPIIFILLSGIHRLLPHRRLAVPAPQQWLAVLPRKRLAVPRKSALTRNISL